MRMSSIVLVALLATASPAWTQVLERPDAASVGARSMAPVPDGARGRQRREFLTMFARAYFPGRSGQVMVVPRAGEMITERDPNYGFMHGSPWDDDVRIPLLFYGPGFIRPGAWLDAVGQQDVAPTLATVLGVAPAATMTGRSLPVLAPGAGRPRAVLLLVLDAGRRDYFDRHADRMPTLSRLRREGAWFDNARIDYLPTLTSVGHATIATGADPRVHGLAANNLFNRTTGRPQGAYANLSPHELMALSISDVWNLATDGQAVIIAQGGADRAVASLAGHGSCLVNGRPVIMASYSASTGRWVTNPDCYRLPDSIAALDVRPLWEEVDGSWMGHDVGSPTAVRSSAIFQRFEGDALVASLEQEPVGADEIPDLILVNVKAPDYVSHRFGTDSEEMLAELAELDRQVARALDVLDAKTDSRYVVAVTADHGMPSPPGPAHTHYNDDIVDLIHERFDASERRVVTYYGDPANAQIYMDVERLASLGHRLEDVAAFLETLPFIEAAFTEDEVRRSVVP